VLPVVQGDLLEVLGRVSLSMITPASRLHRAPSVDQFWLLTSTVLLSTTILVVHVVLEFDAVDHLDAQRLELLEVSGRLELTQ
jgi:hypothetical protein